MDRDERKIKGLLSSEKSILEKCPDLSELASLIDCSLPPESEDKVREHLSNCSTCQELVRLSLELGEEVPGSVPERALAKAVSVFCPTTGQRALQFLKSIFKGRTASPESLALSPAFVFRGAIPARAALGLSGYFQEFGPYRAEIETEQVGEGNWQVRVWVEEKGRKKFARGIRVSINNKDRELESLILDKGGAVFELVPTGAYQVEFWKQGKRLAGIIIRLKGEVK